MILWWRSLAGQGKRRKKNIFLYTTVLLPSFFQRGFLSLSLSPPSICHILCSFLPHGTSAIAKSHDLWIIFVVYSIQRCDFVWPHCCPFSNKSMGMVKVFPWLLFGFFFIFFIWGVFIFEIFGLSNLFCLEFLKKFNMVEAVLEFRV